MESTWHPKIQSSVDRSARMGTYQLTKRCRVQLRRRLGFVAPLRSGTFFLTYSNKNITLSTDSYMETTIGT
jgi:hypothetical protein